LSTIKAGIVEIYTLDRASIAWKVNIASLGVFLETMTQVWREGFVVSERDRHPPHFDRRSFDPYLQLFEPSLLPPYFDPIMIVSEVYLLAAQQLPIRRCACQGSDD
jgi:hypothetical protein